MTWVSTQRLELAEQRYNGEIQQLRTQLSSIHLGMASRKYLDVSSFVATRDDVTKPSNSTFFPEDDFYASSDGAQWSYSKTIELKLGEMILSDHLPVDQFRAIDKLPVHLWRRKDNFIVGGNANFKTVFPYISLERFPMEKVKPLLEVGRDSANALPEKAPVKETLGQQNSLDRLEEVFRGDTTGAVLTSYLSASLVLSASAGPMDLLNVEKVGNVVHCRLLRTLKHVLINNREFSQYYLLEDLILVSDRTSVVFIKIFLPGSDPSMNGEVAQSVLAWLASLKVVVG